MDIDKVKIIKKIGNGMAGIIYLIKYKNKEYALKIEKIPEKYALEKNLNSREWRDIEFSLNFANNYPDQFTLLYKYDIINDCTHIQEYTNDLSTFPEHIQNIIIEKNNSNYCIRKVYSLIDIVLERCVF